MERTGHHATMTGGALFLLSIGITAHQIGLMQILSYVQWYHFAYMVVALALLGFGASGTFFAMFREKLLANSTSLLPLLMFGCGLSMALAISPSFLAPFRFDLYLLFVEPDQILRLTAACLLYFLPFFLGGLAIALALTAGIERTGFLSWTTMSGSGIGGLVGLWLTAVLLPGQLPPLFGLFPIGGGMLLLPWHRWRHAIFTATGPIVCCLVLFLFSPASIPSQFKDISRTLNLPGASIIVQQPSPHGLMQVVAAPPLRRAPGLSLRYQGPVSRYAAILVNGDFYGALPVTAPRQPALLEYSTETLGYLLAKPESVLLLQPGGGDPIDHAFSRGAARIVAVEPHPEVALLLRDGLAGFIRYGSQPQLTLLQADPRGYLAETNERFELIRFPTVNSFSSNIGLYALNEQFLLTREAFSQAWQRLQENGVLMVSAWMDFPVKNPYKLLATLTETLAAAGIADLRSHIAAIRSWGAVTFAVTKKPLTAPDSTAIRHRCREMGFDPLLLPDIDAKERDRYNQLQDSRFFVDIDTLLSSRREQFYKDNAFNIRPPSDNHPYFSQFLRSSRLAEFTRMVTLRQVPFFEMGSFILGITLLILVLLAVGLIVVPLFRLGWHGPGHGRTFLYFGGLGLGYMMTEIVFIQNLTLVLGHPLKAAATVFTALLIFSGLGSLYSEKISPHPATIRRATGLAGLLIILYSYFLIRTGQFVSFAPDPLRLLIAALIIAPIGFILGMPFPLGLRYLHENYPDHIPWAWGINGCFSVIGPVLATIVAVQFGFQLVYILTAAAYFLALGSMGMVQR
jgi:spermidine synthase